jgi:RNase P subunit RPR2
MESTTKPLTRCQSCASPLIYPLSAIAVEDDRVVIDRRCPECEWHDCVVASTRAVAAWARHQRRIRAQLTSADVMHQVDAILASDPSRHGS